MADLNGFRASVRDWLADNLTGGFAALRGLGGPGREHEAHDERIAWDRHLAAAGWTCLGWPVEHGGAGLDLEHRVAFHEEYAAAGAPARVSHVGEELLGPTLIALGTPEQQRRFLPRIKAVDELWCQGYSEPGAGSDLASVSTSATLDGVEWVVTGQKVWTSLAHVAQWCFVLVRTSAGSRRHAGLSYLLVPMDQPGVEVRPIEQLTGGSEFNEVFFDGARTARDLVVGEVGGGWTVAMRTLAFERGAATLGQQVGFRRELDALVALAGDTGVLEDPLLRERLARARLGLEVMRAHALRTIGGTGHEASVTKLVWATWHRSLGELAMDVLGAAGLAAPNDELSEWQRLYLFSRADTIYGGSNEIQRNIIAERVLGLPREARP
ncbi:MAG: acyl-CoA dehydrogenase [Actinophytocola sp.]|uniref:acyl-CoA dehydrogenase family protein n=1 Tax=Actinophytocola sp. TaxID=1872138 RepID=UPI001326107E|nr:acyl-CoA dehydrogenase family protein [Actinophytocola sp.]MPZ80663.1 acyl-CoA dehydrogenase [Actinophytocola sp.]